MLILPPKITPLKPILLHPVYKFYEPSINTFVVCCTGIENGIDDGFSPGHNRPGSRRPSLAPEDFDPEQPGVNYPDVSV